MGVRGMVVSDLHLLSNRSYGEGIFWTFLADHQPFDILVFNGDTFDFGWTDCDSIGEAVCRAFEFLERVAGAFPACRIIYVLGNHDCVDSFVDRFAQFIEKYPQFSLVTDYVRIDTNLFLHGDVCNALTTHQAFIANRRRDARPHRRSTFARWLYQYIILLRLNRIVYLMHAKEEMIRRLCYYLEGDNRSALEGITHVFFGHTHAPFRRRNQRGIEFVNTGSGIRGLRASFSEFAVRGEEQ